MQDWGMTILINHGEGPSFPYAGQQLHVLAGEAGQPAGFATMEIIIPANFAGPIPHAHDQFDEGIYVLHGRLLVAVTASRRKQRQVPCSPHLAGAGTALATHIPKRPWC
jgi:hypothetical protein